jgi:cyclic pyranopterin phosphate synthase
MPAEGVDPCRHEDILSYEEITTFVRLVRAHFNVEKVRITGGDPLARRDIEQFVGMLSKLGIGEITLSTNGQLLAEKAASLKKAGLKRVNISLDSLRDATFREISRGGSLEKTLAGIEAARDFKLDPVKLNMVVIRGMNDNEATDILAFALARGCEVRFIELMPIAFAKDKFNERFVASDEVRERLSRKFTIEPAGEMLGSSSKMYTARDGSGRSGTVGFISSYTVPFCSGCRRLRLTADGRLVGCLARENCVSVKPFLRAASGPDERALVDAVREALTQKRSDRRFARETSMAATGG